MFLNIRYNFELSRNELIFNTANIIRINPIDGLRHFGVQIETIKSDVYIYTDNLELHLYFFESLLKGLEGKTIEHPNFYISPITQGKL